MKLRTIEIIITIILIASFTGYYFYSSQTSDVEKNAALALKECGRGKVKQVSVDSYSCFDNVEYAEVLVEETILPGGVKGLDTFFNRIESGDLSDAIKNRGNWLKIPVGKISFSIPCDITSPDNYAKVTRVLVKSEKLRIQFRECGVEYNNE